MKALSIIILISCTFFTGIQANNFTEGQSLTVVAPSGLSLRTLPSTESRVLEVIDFGSVVTVVGDETETLQSERIGWVDGDWIYVNYDGIEGYIFDGFLSSLPFPTKMDELCEYDMELIYPIEAWAERHLCPTGEIDTVLMENEMARVTHHFDNDQYLIKQDGEFSFKMELVLDGLRIMDAYHLLGSMLPSKTERETFYNASIFIENGDDQVSEIKVNLDHPVTIKKVADDRVKISLFSLHTGCTL